MMPRPTAETRTDERRRLRGDVGVIMAIAGLVILPLLAITGFAVDVGAWYSRATHLQRSADAAALAGVVWMPDTSAAQSAAEDALERNGIVDGVDDVDVTFTPVGEERYRVTVTDNSAPLFFAVVFMDSVTIARQGTAEYILPVPLGSPDNRLGNDPTTGFTPNLWASISGPYTDYNNGDAFSTKCTPGGGSGTGCTQTNPEYRTSGYVYAFDVPSSAVGATATLEIYDAGHYARSNYANVETADNGSVNTRFGLYDADNTVLDNSDNITPGNLLPGCSRTIVSEASSGTYKNLWHTLCTWVVDDPGVHVLQVKSSNISGVTDAGNGWNQFSIKGSLSNGDSPSVYGLSDLSLFNNLPNNTQTNVSALFYLAEIDEIHAGKTLQLRLFDPGDGASGDYFVEPKMPDSTVPSCDFGPDGGSTTTLATCRIQTRSNSSGNQYNGQWLQIDIDIPATYTCGSDCWWEIEYDFENMSSGTSPNDRTVWSAAIVGDPVHLVND